MDRYSARVNLHGTTNRDRNISRLKAEVAKKVINNPSCKDVVINGEETKLVINSGTSKFYKTFQALPGQKIGEGDYVEWANNTWLVYQADVDDEVYIDGDLRQCQYVLYWQNENGDIISRAAWVQNASAYNNGEEGNGTIMLQSNQFMVYMPFDEDTETLTNGMRMNMCKSAKMCRPYELTRPDDITYTYGEKGVLNIIFTQCQFDPVVDKQATLPSGEVVWICDYNAPDDVADNPNETTISIVGGTTLRCGRSKTWSAKFTDSTGEEITRAFSWNVIGDKAISQETGDGKITLKVTDDSLIDEVFTLQIVVSGEVAAETTIVVTGGM